MDRIGVAVGCMRQRQSPKPCLSVMQAGKGLEAVEAARRLDLLGSNAIPYRATSWIRLFVDECFRL